MLTELQQAGYLHVLINHLPIIGTFLGLLGILIGLALRQRRALIPGLVILLTAGISAWPVYETGEAAYKPIRKISDEAGGDWLDEHMDRADQTVWTFYVMAGLAVVAIAATEAPRGLLWHRYEMDADGCVVNARIVPPTAQNQARIEEDLRLSLLNFGLDHADDALRLHCEKVIRNYDPCISCATHFLRLSITR